MTPTKTPWTYVPSYSINKDIVRHTVIARFPDGSEWVVCTAEREDDARHIQRMANLHDPMVHLLRAMLDDGQLREDQVQYVREILAASGNLAPE